VEPLTKEQNLIPFFLGSEPMKSRLFSRILVALGLTATLCAAPLESSACCLWPRSNTTYYAPAVVAPGCNTCNYAPTCNTCNYVPQTAYRSVFSSVPVTSYRPVVSTDPCTGCATTVMRPVTTYQMMPRMVPYTSYRPVAAYYAPAYTPGCATGACGLGGCATGACGASAPVATTYYQPSYSAAAAYSAAPAYSPAPGCSTCNGGSAGSTFAPAAPTTAAPSLPTQSTFTPQPDASSSTAPVPAFRPNTAADATPVVRPIPDLNGPGAPRNSNTIVPRTPDPSDRNTARPREDRLTVQPRQEYLTARPIQNSYSVQRASLVVPVAANQSPESDEVEEGNWRPASR
jgi:hypothetical protein